MFLFYLKQEKEQFAHFLISIILVKKIIPLYTLQFLLLLHLSEATNLSGGLFNTRQNPESLIESTGIQTVLSSFQGRGGTLCI